MTITNDTRLTGAVLQALGFVRQPGAAGEPPVYTLARYHERIDVAANAAAWGGGWDLAGMKPADVGDLIVMSLLAGVRRGRRELLYETLDHVAIKDVADWVNGVKNMKFVDANPDDEDPPFPADGIAVPAAVLTPKKKSGKGSRPAGKAAGKTPARRPTGESKPKVKAKPKARRRARSASDKALELTIRG